MIERFWTATAIGALLMLTAACDQEPASQSAVSDAATESENSTPELTESNRPLEDNESEVDSN